MRPALKGTASALAAGSSVSGVLAYVFFSIVTRTLGAAEAAPLSVLWTYWSATAAVLTFPLQHWIARSVAAHKSQRPVHEALPKVTALVVVLAAGAALGGWAGRHVLFHRPDAVFPALLGVVTLGGAFIGTVRGGLAATRRFTGVAWALVGENAVRCLGAAALGLAGVRTAGPYGIVLAAGPLVGLLWPRAFRFRADGGAPEQGESAMSFLGSVAGGSLLGQLILTGGPVALALLGGAPADVTSLFATLALFRAPYTLGVGLVSALTGRLTALVVGGRGRDVSRLVFMVVGGALAAAGIGGLAGSLVGGVMTRAVFGPEIHLPPLFTGLIVAGSVMALGNLVVTVALVARARVAVVLRAWLGACAVAAITLFIVPDGPLTRVVVAFVTAEAGALLLMGADHIAPLPLAWRRLGAWRVRRRTADHWGR